MAAALDETHLVEEKIVRAGDRPRTLVRVERRPAVERHSPRFVSRETGTIDAMSL
jgi:hypothetical protein